MKGKQIALAAAVLMFSGLPLHGDVIYLKTGNVLVVEKAWQEGDQVKYQTASGLQTIPLASVKRLQGQKPAAADPSHNQAVQAVVIRGQGTPACTIRCSQDLFKASRRRFPSQRPVYSIPGCCRLRGGLA